MIDWYEISKQKGLSEEFMRENKEHLDWLAVSNHQVLSEDFILEYGSYIDWRYASIKQNLTIPVLERYKKRINWDLFSQNEHLTKEIMIQYRDNLNWNKIYFHHPEKFEEIKDIARAEERIKWGNMHVGASIAGKLNEEFLLQFQKKLDWEKILTLYIDKIELSTIEKVKQHVYWKGVSLQVSEEVHLEKLKDYLDWNTVSLNQNMRFNFLLIKKYVDYLHIPILMERYRLDENTLEWLHIQKKIDWEKVAYCQKPNFKFTEAFIEEIDIEVLKEQSPTLYTEEQWNVLFAKKKKSNWKQPWKMVKKLLKRA